MGRAKPTAPLAPIQLRRAKADRSARRTRSAPSRAALPCRLSEPFCCAWPACLLGGCAATERLPSPCDAGHRWLADAQPAAEHAYRYALLALDVYDRPDGLGLPPGFRRDSLVTNPRTGFAAAVYSDTQTAAPVTAVAYRGTSALSARDWLYGNLLARQNGEGLALLEAVRRALPARRRVAVTGHSLGGGIALSVSFRVPNTPAFAFGTSPRFTRGPDVENDRLLISTKGDVLAPGRLLHPEAFRERVLVECQDGNPLVQHDARRLALCLTQIAAIREVDARAVLKRNRVAQAYGSCARRQQRW